MKQTLQLRIGQQLTMTPQLQQAIQLLQLSTLDLRAEIQQALESNLMLEAADEQEIEGDDTASDETVEDTEQQDTELNGNEVELQTDRDLPEDLPVDTGWDDIYEPPATNAAPPDEELPSFDQRNSRSETLQDYLNWQLELTRFSNTERVIATAIVDAINEDGYLTSALEDIHGSLGNELDVEPEEIGIVLHHIQHFDPPGIAARDLSECLALQVQQLPADTEARETALKLVKHYLDLLAKQDLRQLQRRLGVDEETVRAAIAIIRTLDPRPGSRIGDTAPDYVVPDVVVQKNNGAWRVELNPEALPRIRINREYAQLVRRADSSADNACLKNHLQEARWFLRSLKSRNETLLKVASAIVERQQAFLEEGDEAMRPLTLHDIAEAVEMHESTISRVTNQKYMYTPRGIFEFKYFFSSQLTTADGDGCSATAIRAQIKKLIAAEEPTKPLSDSRISEILNERGINVARRTVAKYREAMDIAPSSQRRQRI